MSLHVTFFYSNMVPERVKPICSLLEYICGKSPCRSLQGFFIFLAFKQCRSIEKAEKAVRQRGMAKKEKSPTE